MRKGELRKDSILNTAEELFIGKGYAETSIQDILDALSLSKGGFYHYFESKLQLLEEITARRAEAEVARLQTELTAQRMKPTEKLSRLFSAVQLVNCGSVEFGAMTLQVGFIDGDVNFREKNRSFLLENLCGMADRIVREGVTDGSFFVRHPDRMSRVMLVMACDANDECCRILAENPENPECAVEILRTLDVYQDCIERLLGARFGTVALCQIEPVVRFVRQISESFARKGEVA